MAAIKNFKKVGAEFPNSVVLHRAIYDFSIDAGAIGALDVFEAVDDMVILSAYANVKTLCTSADAATVAIGIDADPDTIIDETAVASLTAGALIQQIAAVSPRKLPSGSKVKINIADFALTAGKIEIVLLMAKF
ncbi:MAG: hypothetical protein ACP5N7_01995 [Candidatus Pacearchaeota archaeon]